MPPRRIRDAGRALSRTRRSVGYEAKSDRGDRFGSSGPRVRLGGLRPDRLQEARPGFTVGTERPDGRYQPRHPRRDQGRRRRDQGRQGHRDVVPPDRRRPALRHPLHEDDPHRHVAGPGRRVRGERADLHGRHLAQPEPRRHASRRARAHRAEGLLLQPDRDGQVHQPEQHDQARSRAPQVFRDAGRARGHGQGVPGGQQVQGQRGVQEAVPRQGHLDHRRRHPGRSQDVQRHAARGRSSRGSRAR